MNLHRLIYKCLFFTFYSHIKDKHNYIENIYVANKFDGGLGDKRR